jgi:ParB family chromosome partitioning protein
MATQSTWLTHRGTPTALISAGGALFFGTRHPEGLPTALYRLNPTDGALTEAALPTHPTALATSDDTVWIAGADAQLYRAPVKGGAASAVGALPSSASALVVVNSGLAAICDDALLLLDLKAKTIARFALPAAGTALTADDTGDWLVAGTKAGHLASFNAEEGSWTAGDADKIHEGAITSLVFEHQTQRVISAGLDGTLRVTHARGRLDGEDRGGRAAHAAVAMLNHGEKLYSVSKDELKGWTANSKRPQSWTDGVGRAIALACVEIRGRATLAVATQDGAIRLFLLDGAGKIDHRNRVFHHAYATAEHSFSTGRPAERLSTLSTLAGYADGKAIDLINDRAWHDDDHGVKVAATAHLGQSNNPRAVPHLLKLLKARTEGVRLSALTGLRTHHGATSLDPLHAAIKAGSPDIGVAAVEALQGLAPKNAQAHEALYALVQHRTKTIREAGLFALEALVGTKDAQPSHLAAASQHADLRWLAIVRLMKRDLLTAEGTDALLRRLCADADATVRRAAFIARVASRPTLADALRSRDITFNRQLHELVHHGEEKPGEPSKLRKVPAKNVTEGDRAPLLEALATRALDVCVAGAAGLASIEDPRAFGTLLQLTREADDDARVEATRAFEALADPRALPRLRQLLRDANQGVRDAAFSALSRLLTKQPLEAAEAGLLSPHEDVRRRALRKLLTPLRKTKPENRAPEALALVRRALDDNAPSLRTETFKAVLNLQLGGEGDQTLRFALNSRHADIRREVLTEVMAELAQPWAWSLLLHLFEDPDAGLRREAFDFARKKARGRSPAPAGQALLSPFADLRRAATEALATKPDAAALAQLATAMGDADAVVRRKALAALQAANDLDRLAEGLASPHADVKMAAAAALAEQGDARAAKVLSAQLAEPEPETTEAKQAWIDQTKSSLQGLAALAFKKASEPAAALLNHADAGVREAAADALAWLAPIPEVLEAALRHSDGKVQHTAALGLARMGHRGGIPLLFQPQAAPAAPARGRNRRRAEKKTAVPAPAGRPALEGALCLRAGDLLTGLMEHPDETIRRLALKSILLSAWRGDGGALDHLMAALSAPDFRVRLLAAEALERLNSPAEFEAFVVARLNARDTDGAAWAIDAPIAAQLADALVRGDGRLAARALPVLEAAEAREAPTFTLAWARFAKRHSAELARLGKKAAKAPKAPKGLDALVFGAYVGLSRLGASGGAAARARRTASDRLAALVASERLAGEAVWPALLPGLADDARVVREAAFNGLATAGYPAAELASAALATGNAHVGALALDLLSKTSGGDGALEHALRTRTDGVEDAALQRLVERQGPVPGNVLGLAARSSRTRTNALRGLAGALEKHPKALPALRKALKSPHADVRYAATGQLAILKDKTAYDALLVMLAEDGRPQTTAIRMLSRLGDLRTPAALLDRIEQDPRGTAEASPLLDAVGGFRQADATPRLLAAFEAKKPYADGAWQALHTISGYDQWISIDADDDDDAEYARVTKEQHPRDGVLLAQMIAAATALGDLRRANRLLDASRWAPTGTVDEAVAALCRVKDDSTRQTAVEVAGWRLRRREGPPEPLHTALKHRDPLTGFEAARSLALAGHADGVSMLLTTIELGEDLDQRRGAVEALGVLGDPRGLDPLLKLVKEDGHALQEPAAAAIGRLAEGPHRDAIFTLLERLAYGPVGFADNGLASHALTGLRWFRSAPAWALIRKGAGDEHWVIREQVAKLLEHDPASDASALLGTLIREDDDWDVAVAASRSLRARTGPDSLELDYQLVQSTHDDLEDDTVDRLVAKGDPATLFALLPKIRSHMHDTYLEPLADALRAQAPVAAALQALSADDASGFLAAHIVGQVGDASHGDAVASALDAAHARWTTLHEADPNDARLGDVITRLARLVWAAGRTGAAPSTVVALCALGGEQPSSAPVRVAALTALAEGLGGAAALDVLEAAATGANGDLRTIGSAGLARRDAQRAAALVPKALDDRSALARLLADGVQADDALRAAAGGLHTQGVTLPHLIARGDVTGLGAAAADGALPEAARQGALEGLARIADEAVDAHILAVATAETEDEALRKAAWRALRRARRLRARQAEVRS